MALDEQQLGPLIEQAGYQYVNGSGWGNTALWIRGTWDGPNNDHFTPDDKGPGPYSQEMVANTLFPTSSPYLKPTAQPGMGYGNAPEIRYDGQGKAFTWDNGKPVPLPQFDDYTKAAGYRPPSTAQPRVPQYVTDPTTGRMVEAGPGVQAGWPGISPQDERMYKLQDAERAAQQRLAELQDQRSYNRDEGDRTRTFNSQENATDRASRAQESAYDRALRIAESDANTQYRNATLGLQAQQQAESQRMARENQQQSLRKDYASMVSSTDTAALPAFLQAGGGNFFNAQQANPYGALTNNALLPAAQTLHALDPNSVEQQAQRAQQESAQNWQAQLARENWGKPEAAKLASDMARGQAMSNRINAQPSPGFTQPGTTVANAGGFTWNPNDQNGGGIHNQAGQASSFSAQPMGSASSATAGGPNGAVDAWQQGQPVQGMPLRGFAGGTPQYGFVNAPQQGFMTSEQGPEFMRVQDPPGANNARIMVVPGFAMGTQQAMQPAGAGAISADPTQQGSNGFDANGQAQVSAIDQPYVEQVRQFRQSRPQMNVGFGAMDPRFSRQVDPTLRQAYWQNEQTRLGVPAASLAFDAERFTPHGFRPYEARNQWHQSY